MVSGSKDCGATGLVAQPQVSHGKIPDTEKTLEILMGHVTHVSVVYLGEVSKILCAEISCPSWPAGCARKIQPRAFLAGIHLGILRRCLEVFVPLEFNIFQFKKKTIGKFVNLFSKLVDPL
jgi:hypothetical protein